MDAAEIRAAVQSTVIEGSLTLQEATRLLLAAMKGKTDVTDNGDGTKTIHFRDAADSKNRISATVTTADKARTAVTVDGS